MLHTVSRHLTAIEAHIIRTRLEAEEIPAFINSEYFVGLDWSMALAVDYIKVQVPHQYVGAALQVLDNIDRGVYQKELETELGAEASEQPVCPKCGSHEIIPVTWPAKFCLFSLFLLIKLPIPYTQHLKRCNTCGNHWIARQERGYPLYVPTGYILIWAAIFTALTLAISPPLEDFLIYGDEIYYIDEGSDEYPFGDSRDNEFPNSITD